MGEAKAGPAAGKLFALRTKAEGEGYRYVKSTGYPDLTTTSLNEARKFSTGGDAALFLESAHVHGNAAWGWRPHYEVVPIPADMLDPLTGQYVGKGGAA